ncbi:MAG: hypothetical protein MH252_18635 [Thermosynechococcaceae cyanobacterium MS004]|nr:hypothetical protein [Thermosynechococcaceae cyanobacterium MS004]
MKTAKSGMLIIHAIALTALWILDMGQVQVQQSVSVSSGQPLQIALKILGLP